MRTNHKHDRQRQGFTKMEWVALIACIAIIMALLIPFVEMERDRGGRRNECSSHLINISKATIQYVMSHGRYPGYVNDFGSFQGDRDPAAPDDVSSTYRAGDKKLGSWVVPVLPQLDAQAAYEVWTQSKYPLLKTSDGVTEFLELAAPNLPIAQCPNSPTLTSERGRNSYIANTGMHHVSASGLPLKIKLVNGDEGAALEMVVSFEDSMQRSNGIFNNQYDKAVNVAEYPVGPPITIEDLKDGAGNTAMFSESLQAVPWHLLDPDPAEGIRLLQPASPDNEVTYPEYSRFTQGMVWFYEDPEGANGAPKPPTYRRQIINSVPPKQDRLSLTMSRQNAVELARPSSAHSQGCNFGFADGSTRFVMETIDYRVYQALFTPRGKSSFVPEPTFIPPADSI